ncbi:MAG: membrane protein insertase YidC [Rickettsiales bacterium]|jgi:YidC/Oxa1 family membrane protein insertase|nr:membrane protein insertase YidC [Rickettsiales bacterium]
MKIKNPEKRKELLIKILAFSIIFVVWQRVVVKPIADRMREKNNGIVDFTKDSGEETAEAEEVEDLGKNFTLENDFLKLTVNSRGLKLDDLELKKYRRSTDDDGFVKLLNSEKKNYYYIKTSWLSSDRSIELPSENTPWKFDEMASGSDKLIFTFVNGQKITFTVTLFFDDKYLLTIQQSVQNNSLKSASLRPVVEIIKFDNADRGDAGIYNGGIGVFDKNEAKEIKTAKLKNRSAKYDKFRWAGFTSKYWLTAIVNKNLDDGKINFLKTGRDLRAQHTVKNNIIASSGDRAEYQVEIFLGAKDRNILWEYETKNGFLLFHRSVDYGLFSFITKPMSALLNFLFSLGGDFGLAVILLTLIVKIVLYPSTKKTAISMFKMKLAQPKIKEIQQKYKDDKPTMQRELLKTYKTYGINPLGSLTPFFIQIPIFLSLYKVLNISLEMRQANFFFFARDLSAADPSNIFNLCGLLPFNPPIRIGVLPFLMALTTFLQQKFLGEHDQGQNDEMKTALSISKWMPLLLLFMFYGLPSGLLLYWVLNNIITIVQQIYIEKKYCKQVH